VATLKELYDDNPWWESQDNIDNDPKITDWNESKIKWDPRIRSTFDYSTDIIYSIRGPRQVGKTTLIKLQIRDFLKKGISPWNIMYYSFDTDKSSKRLVELIENYLNSTKRLRGKGRSYLFLDEVSKVPDWFDGIKRLHDQGKLKNFTVVVSGSHTIDLKKSLENLTGRRGKTNDAYDKVLLPMKFSEYVMIRDESLKSYIIKNNLNNRTKRKKLFTDIMKQTIDEDLDQLQTKLQTLNDLLIDYMITGGNPEVVDTYHQKHFLDNYLYTKQLDYILGDLKNLNKNEQYFRQIITNIINNNEWPHSWLSIQKDTDIRNSDTVADYVDILQNMFVLTMFHFYDPSKKRIMIRKNKKIHFHDPFFFHSLKNWITGGKSFQNSLSFVQNHTNQGFLAEGIVGDHLIRLAFGLNEQKQNFNYHNHVFYWNKERTTEVDFIFKTENIELPIEVKFQNKIESKHFKGLKYYNEISQCDSSLMISKNDMDTTDNSIIIPASVFLLLI